MNLVSSGPLVFNIRRAKTTLKQVSAQSLTPTPLKPKGLGIQGDVPKAWLGFRV